MVFQVESVTNFLSQEVNREQLLLGSAQKLFLIIRILFQTAKLFWYKFNSYIKTQGYM